MERKQEYAYVILLFSLFFIGLNTYSIVSMAQILSQLYGTPINPMELMPVHPLGYVIGAVGILYFLMSEYKITIRRYTRGVFIVYLLMFLWFASMSMVMTLMVYMFSY